MSESYKPDADALPEPPYDTAFLSQRDLGLNVPINYVTTPGISLTAACFPFLRYEDDDAAICISNLIANGFRRLEIDLYWDQMREVWSFCPAEVPVSSSSAVNSQTPTSTLPSTTASLTSEQQTTNLIARQDAVSSTSISSSIVTNIGSTSSLSSSTPTLSAVSMMSSSLVSTLPTTSTTSAIPNSSNEPLYNIGPYTCTSTINLYMLTSLLLDYIQKTENTIDAHMSILTLNIHAAKLDTRPDDPAPQPIVFPDALKSLGSLFSATLSAYIYTPNDLRSNRANLNTSWYSVIEKYRPALDYYTINTQEFGIQSTEDGWPSESYVEFSQGKRMLLQFGSVDPQMTKYNFSADSGTIFAPGYINNPRENEILASADGVVESGCFLKNAIEQVSDVNSSWATASNIPGFSYPTTPTSNLTHILNLSSSLTNCGISPILNTTLLNSTASTNNHPYQNYTHSTLWSWGHSEPRNSSSVTSDSLFRCTSLNTNTSHWHVTDCSTKLHAACRSPTNPYNWTLTTYPISYSYAPLACPIPYLFATPSTSLENTHLLLTIRSLSPSLDLDTSSPKIWLDFNSLHTKYCWVTGGPNATCPYASIQINSEEEKKVLVPIVASIIVLIISVVVVMVKWARGTWAKRGGGTRRRRRAEYLKCFEGVPA